jgi:hypothetical protein
MSTRDAQRRLDALERQQHRVAMGKLAATLADAYGLDAAEVMTGAERLAALEATYGWETTMAMVAFEDGIDVEDLRQGARDVAAEQGLVWP